MTQVRLSVGPHVLTRNLSQRGGGTSESVVVSLLPLAQMVARSWWPLFGEPFRSGAGPAFRARHRLDIPQHGYVFPKVALCSGGQRTLLVAWSQEIDENSRVEFLTPSSMAPEVLNREVTEQAFMDVVELNLEILSNKSHAYQDLYLAWSRIQESLNDPEEFSYCQAAGKFGIDPYDANAPDFASLSADIRASVFDDVSDAAFLEELFQTTQWINASAQIWENAPEIEVRAFGEFPPDDLSRAAWEVGTHAAKVFRTNTGATVGDPRKHLESVFGAILQAKSAAFSSSPDSVRALIARRESTARVATVARSAREQRFKVCSAAYLAWEASPGQDRAATPAFTRSQQAARAFAAELLAPRDYLCSLAPRHGFTPDRLENLAGRLICPYETMVWQAHNSGIPLRGVEMPTFHYLTLV